MSADSKLLEYGIYEHQGEGVRREWMALIGPEGAVEMWRRPLRSNWGDETHLGGIEIHSRTQLFDFAPDPFARDCRFTGGDCYSDGSCIAFERLNVNALIATKDWLNASYVLEDWYRTHLLGDDS